MLKNRSRTVILTALALGALALLLSLAWPWLAAARYVMALSSMAAPQRLPMPVTGVAARAIRDTWHAARAPARQHEGIDIFARKGTQVTSATEGIVLSQGQNTLGGNVVWVLGPAGHRHYYAHLDQFANLPRGARVMPGTVLGTVGNTGNARTTPAHLHYGIYTAGGAINPYPLLASRPVAPP